MNSNVASLVLEHLKALRHEVSEFRSNAEAEFAALKQRVGSAESGVAQLHADVAIVHNRLDRIDSRVERIERRRNLVDV